MHRYLLIFLPIILLFAFLAERGYFSNPFTGDSVYRLDKQQKREWFELTDEHLSLMRKMQVAWSPMESGAPFISLNKKHLSSGRAHAKIGYAVEIFLQKAQLAAGTYSYENPLYEHREVYSKRLQKLSGWPDWAEVYPTDKIVQFDLTKQHLKLIKHAQMRVHPNWSDGAVGAINEKRPYGDFTYFEADMAKILGLPTGINAKRHVTMSKQQEQMLFNLHLQTMKAVQVFLLNAKLTPGRYTRSPAGYGPWRRQSLFTK